MSNFEVKYMSNEDTTTKDFGNEIELKVSLKIQPSSDDYKRLLEIMDTLEELADAYINFTRDTKE